MALPPLLPPDVIALLLPWLPVDRPDDRHEELQKNNVSFVFFFIFLSFLSQSFPPAGTENPGKLDATSDDLASAPMRAPIVPVVVSAQRVYMIYIIVYNIYIYISNESQAECKSLGLSL